MTSGTKAFTVSIYAYGLPCGTSVDCDRVAGRMKAELQAGLATHPRPPLRLRRQPQAADQPQQHLLGSTSRFGMALGFLEGFGKYPLYLPVGTAELVGRPLLDGIEDLGIHPQRKIFLHRPNITFSLLNILVSPHTATPVYTTLAATVTTTGIHCISWAKTAVISSTELKNGIR